MEPGHARAFSVAFIADLARNPSLSMQVARGHISASKLRDEAFKDVVAGVTGKKKRHLFPNVQKFVKLHINSEKKRLHDAGIGAESSVWDAIGGAITGAADIVSGVLTSKYKASGDKAVAGFNAQSQQLNLQAQQLAAQTAERMASAGTASTSATPGWVTPVAIGGGLLLIGGVIYAVTRR
jgi:putative sterol carrier protein